MIQPDVQALPITVAIQTKNEATSITSCINSLHRFSQILVVDSNSTDSTAELARAAGAEVINFTWNGHYPKKKQWILEEAPCRNNWVFLIDADERISAQLEDELDELVQSQRLNTHAAYNIGLDYVFAGRVLRHGHRVMKTALVNKRLTRYEPVNDLECQVMGELEGHYQPIVDGTIGTLQSRILHNDPDPISTWVARHNKYSDWEAYLRVHPEVANSVNRMRTRQGRTFAKAPAKPLLFFIYDYVVRRGFLDGRAGFDYAVALSWYYWLTDLKWRDQRNTGRQL